MFTNFERAKYPEYEVILPQTHYSFTVRTLTVTEEERMKGSLVTPLKIADHLNKCIWNNIVSKPETIQDYKTFLASITVKDREALLYGLYHISHGDIRNYSVTCPYNDCNGHKYDVTIPISSTFNFNAYPSEDILSKKIKLELPIFKGVYAFIKQPTLEEEIKFLKDYSDGQNNSLIISTMIIDRFEEESLKSKDFKVYNDRQDIMDAYKTLPSIDKRAINSSYIENFGKYGIDLKMRVTCPKCSNSEVINIDLVEQFFRMVFIVQ